MTTPYQTAPDGAYVVGGGTWNYGQTMNEDIGRAAFEFPMPNPTNMLDLLRIALERLPIEALQPFADFLGVVDGVFDSIGQAVDAIIGGLIVRPILQTVENFTQWVVDFFQSMGSGLLSGDLGDFGEWFDDTVTQPIIGTVDGFIRGVLGLIGSGFNVNIVEDTAKSLADAIASMNEIVTRLDQKATTGDFSGTAAVVNFASEAAGPSLGSKWAQTHSGTGTGTLGISGGRAKWSGSASNRTGIARYTDELCTSDYQKVGAAFATLPSTNFLGGWNSYNYLYARMNAAADTYVYAKLGSGSLQLGCVVDGTQTVFSTNTTFKFKPGTAYWLEAGTTGGVRIFRVWENSRIIMTYTDASAISQLGHRHVGMGVTSFSDTYRPAEVSSFAFYDNSQPPTKGSGFHIMRTSTSTVSQPSGVNLIPGSFFDTPDRQTDDYKYDSATNKLTVSVAGWYIVNMKIRLAADTLAVGGTAQPLLYVNGEAVQAGWETWYTGPASWGGSSDTAATFIQYLNKDDYIQPGFYTNRAINLIGGESGVQTNFSCAFLNNVRPT